MRQPGPVALLRLHPRRLLLPRLPPARAAGPRVPPPARRPSPQQRDKTAIILKYEIGFSRYLILGGYHLATFVDGILPYHPVYRASAFDLMADGFPLLKRQFLYENPFSAPDLRRWKQRVLDARPRRRRRRDGVATCAASHRPGACTAASPSAPDPTARRCSPSPSALTTFADEDRWVPSFDHWWGFPVDPRTGLLSGAVRAVFDAVRDDPSIKKIVLEGSRPLSTSGPNVVRVATESPPGQMYCLRMGTIFTSVGAPLRRQPPALAATPPLRPARAPHRTRAPRRRAQR